MLAQRLQTPGTGKQPASTDMTIRTIVAALACASLAGCAVPPVVQMISWGVTGVSYIATGKGLSEHVLSVALDRDCAVMHVLDGEAFCLPWDGPVPNDSEDTDTLVAFSENPGSDTRVPELRLSGEAATLDGNELPGETRSPVTLRVETSLFERPELFVVRASFDNRAAAEKFRTRRDIPDAVVASVQERGTSRFLVARGPFGESISALTRSEEGAAELSSGRPIWLCPTSLNAPPCRRAVLAANTGEVEELVDPGRVAALVIDPTPQ
jgi:hypothetical protein